MEPKRHHLAKHRPSVYRIVVQEPLEGDWAIWFDGMSVVVETSARGIPTTVLTGLIADQAALRGLLAKIWDMNLTVISLSRIETL
jgi:hypothetical protein